MKIKINFFRIILTLLVCLLLALFQLKFVENDYKLGYLTPLVLTISVLVTNFDKLRESWKFWSLPFLAMMLVLQAFVLVLCFFVLTRFTSGFSSLLLLILVSGLLSVLIFNIVFKLESAVSGFGAAALLTLCAPLILEWLQDNSAISHVATEKMSLVLWQLYTGFVLSCAMWIKKT